MHFLIIKNKDEKNTSISSIINFIVMYESLIFSPIFQILKMLTDLTFLKDK